jgi:phosphate transport system substrate-binding protein
MTRFALLAATLAGFATTLPAQRPGTDTLRIDGSNGVMPLARAIGAAFQAHDPSVVVAIGGGLGGKARLEALGAGSIHIALASHGLDMADLERQGMVAHRLAVSPVVFAVHPSVTVSNLSAAQLCDAFSGRASTWASLGGAQLRLMPILRPENEVDTEVIRAGIPCLTGVAVPPSVAVVETTDDMARAIQSNVGAIGVTTSTVVQQNEGRMRAIAVDGVAATPDEVMSGRYRLVRPAYFVTGRKASPVVVRFLAYARSAAGQAVIRASGALPTP